MIKVLMEVDTHATCLTVSVLAESLVEAISTVQDRYPDGDIRVVFPINPGEFFIGHAGATCLLELDDSAQALADVRQGSGASE